MADASLRYQTELCKWWAYTVHDARPTPRVPSRPSKPVLTVDNGQPATRHYATVPMLLLLGLNAWDGRMYSPVAVSTLSEPPPTITLAHSRTGRADPTPDLSYTAARGVATARSGALVSPDRKVHVFNLLNNWNQAASFVCGPRVPEAISAYLPYARHSRNENPPSRTQFREPA